MEHGEIELLLGREMPHTGYERLPERPVIRPFGKDFVDGRIVDGRLALGVLWYGQALPLHPRVEHPQDEVKYIFVRIFFGLIALLQTILGGSLRTPEAFLARA